MDTFPHKDRSLENDPPSHRKPMETAYDRSDMVIASYSIETLNEPQYFPQIAAVSPECQLLPPTERCSSPSDINKH